MDAKKFFFGLWRAMYYRRLCRCSTELRAVRIHFRITVGLSQQPGQPTFFLELSEVSAKVSVSRAALIIVVKIDSTGNVQLATYAGTSLDVS